MEFSVDPMICRTGLLKAIQTDIFFILSQLASHFRVTNISLFFPLFYINIPLRIPCSDACGLVEADNNPRAPFIVSDKMIKKEIDEKYKLLRKATIDAPRSVKAGLD